ncbi:MAG: hypothetical protein ACOX3E_00230 [Desulfomonilia bacterium]|uniref:Antitoxin n=1 Tax=anaerobic digester metagenome TaxID=1263854 RepID=A0A485M2P4_9ZZZZ|nr:hypothetical protein [Pseudomonadota bacterium]HON38191.1 hypothetical protein [Deltaproteobacteria bacterium]HRS56460.1 hypothetical protein [Desulfomonilia bacterium]HPD22714.1 hypothetical protein [Deltaproteobacteria bacterium]HPW69504.1 hypothetical protein [Deltaproteobacteria bacterium]
MKKKVILNDYEKEFVESFERGEWKSVPNVEQEIKKHRKIAAEFNRARKDENINIRIAKGDKEALKARAREEGIPYQTLLASIIHKYVTGRLVESR